MERIGIYGGTFNPPHAGHIQAAKQAVTALKLDKLVIVPTSIAPHKAIPEHSPTPRQRLEMLRIAAADCPKAEVSDIELNRGGISYTFQTVSELKERCPDAELILLMGSDMFLCFDQWKQTDDIMRNVELGVFYRGSKGEKTAVAESKAKLEQRGAKICLVENDIVDISSTQLRRMLAFHCAGPFLSPGVAAYIREHGLYDVNAQWKNLPMAELEQVVIRLLNPNRVAHVLGCRDTAVALAKRWGADVTDAARAGILHDITKALDAKKGQNIKLLKIDRVSSLADYFLICTGTSNTHVKTLCDYAEYTLEQLGEQMLSREGHRGNSWELLDYGSIVVHVFTEEARKFYDLERLWADAELVDIRDIIIEEN